MSHAYTCKYTSCVSNCCCLDAKSCPTLATPWTVASQAPLSMRFPRQEYWSRLPFPSPGLEPKCPALPGGFFTAEPPAAAKSLQLCPTLCEPPENPEIEYLGLIPRDLDPESLKVRPKNMHFLFFCVSFLATAHGLCSLTRDPYSTSADS